MAGTSDAPRPIPSPCCSWCGHSPHQQSCPGTIRTGADTSARLTLCPCSHPRDDPATTEGRLL